jgi:YHS domain-containing protein
MNQHDPVCNKALRPTDVVASVTYAGTIYHFCSQECHGRFWANPARYAGTQRVDTEANPTVTPVSFRPARPWHQTE